MVTTINSLDRNIEIVSLKSKISKIEVKLLKNDEEIHGLKMEYSNSYKNMETAIKDATSKAESNTKSMVDSIKSARDTIDDIAESIDNLSLYTSSKIQNGIEMMTEDTNQNTTKIKEMSNTIPELVNSVKSEKHVRKIRGSIVRNEPSV